MGQKLIKDSERLVYLPLGVYSANLFMCERDSVNVALVGDAAFGVPYFKALNNGF